jgi:hypothetical protein
MTPRLLWGLWLAALAGGVFIVGSLTYDRAVWALFAMGEAWGAYSRTSGDTLSEFAEWVRCEFAPRPAGNWLAAGIIVLCAWHAGFVASFGYAGEAAMQTFRVGGVGVATYGPNMVVGAMVSVFVVAILTSHFFGARR